MRRDTLYNRTVPKVMAMLLVLTLMLSAFPAASAAEYEGTCGKNLSWSFELGTLTITGSGDMTDYDSEQEVPWYAFREQIFCLMLPEGLTRVGNMAFAGCKNLTAAVIPGSVRQIGGWAFMGCTGLSILRLPEGLLRIEENAFEQCSSLQELRLPDTLTTLEWQAFYRCESLRTVEIPESVKEMGSGVFAYCYGLVRAVIRAPLTMLPRWTFYGCASLTSIELPPETREIGHYGVRGCESLTVVYYDGEPGDAEELKQQISEENEDFADNGTVSGEKPEESDTVNREVTDENGDTIEENTTVTETDESTITVTEKENVSDPEAEAPPTDISATVVEKDGWDQVLDAVKDALKGGGSANVEIYVGADLEVPDSLLEELAGEDVKMTVIGTDGGRFTLDFSEIKAFTEIEGLDLSYRLRALDKEYEVLEGAGGYLLNFNKSSTIQAELQIRLPIEHARKSVTLYQIEWGKPRQLQSVVADENGVAHFYVASVDSKMDYLLGINVPSVRQLDLLIPESLEKEYGVTDRLSNVEYVVTGRVSSWGMTSGQVSRVMVGFMLSTAAFVGLLMYALNKRKIRQGFVPGWDDAEDDE